MALEGAGDLAMSIILAKLEATDAAKVACVNRRFRVWASEESLWRSHCAEELDLSAPLDPSGNPTPSFRESYQAWREAFGMYPWPLVMRVKRCWDGLKNWFRINFKEVMDTFRRGASEEVLNELERNLGVRLPLPSRVIYRFCSGQDIPRGKLWGLIGGYSFYNRSVNVCLLPLDQIITVTRRKIDQLGFSSGSKYIVVASSCTYTEKFFFLNCANGQIYVGTINLAEDGEMMPCVPDTAMTSVHGYKQQDAMLLWLEEHGRRLHNGLVGVREEYRGKSINLFPELPPCCSAAVTNGVQIRASAVFIPEESDLQGFEDKYLFAYSIRMSLLPEGCTARGVTYSTCQLYCRHWIIRANENVEHDFSGEAVIGQYPVLFPGDKEFVYQSCLSTQSSSGSMEGSFIFVPGRLTDPKGDPFDVEVARFPLKIPEYIF
ncbi:F-box protein skip16 [Ancistrocladus abbreviatus]